MFNMESNKKSPTISERRTAARLAMKRNKHAWRLHRDPSLEASNIAPQDEADSVVTAPKNRTERLRAAREHYGMQTELTPRQKRERVTGIAAAALTGSLSYAAAQGVDHSEKVQAARIDADMSTPAQQDLLDDWQSRDLHPNPTESTISIRPEVLSDADNALIASVLETPVERQTLQMGAVFLAPGTEVLSSDGKTVFTIEAGTELKVKAGMLNEAGRLVFTMSNPETPNEPVELLQANFDLINTDGVGNARYESSVIENGLPGSIGSHTHGQTPDSSVSFMFHNYDGFIRHIDGKGPDQIVANAEFSKIV